MTSRRVWLTIPAKIHVLNAPSEYLMQSSYVLAKASKPIKSGSVLKFVRPVKNYMV